MTYTFCLYVYTTYQLNAQYNRCIVKISHTFIMHIRHFFLGFELSRLIYFSLYGRICNVLVSKSLPVAVLGLYCDRGPNLRIHTLDVCKEF